MPRCVYSIQKVTLDIDIEPQQELRVLFQGKIYLTVILHIEKQLARRYAYQKITILSVESIEVIETM